MKNISKILVAVDGKYDRRSLVNEIFAVAGEYGAQVTLLGIIDLLPTDPNSWDPLSNLYEWTLSEQIEELTKLRQELEKSGISAAVMQTLGRPYEQVIQAAITGGFDLIMKPATDEREKPRFLFGSTDMQLFRLSPVPVWLFKPTPANRLAKVMVAVDLLAFDEEKSALATKVLEWGKSVAVAVGAELHVLHTWDIYRELSLRGQIGPESVDKLQHVLEHRHRQWLDEAISQSGLARDRITIHFQKGDAKVLIPEIAQAEKIDLLVMGTVGRTGIPGFFIGNTADSVLRRVNCSVLAIKPDGFRTPIKDVRFQPAAAA